MNENIDLTQILKDCPKGWKFYSSLHGELLYSWMYLSSSASKIMFIKPDSTSMIDGTPITVDYYRDGRYFPNQGECTLFPSKNQRDWSKFTAPWYKSEKKKFDPKNLQPFDKVIVKGPDSKWVCGIFSHYDKEKFMPYICIGWFYDICIPYNDDTKHLLGTTDEAPEYYRYWED